jgi:hypothetical protein
MQRFPEFSRNESMQVCRKISTYVSWYAKSRLFYRPPNLPIYGKWQMFIKNNTKQGSFTFINTETAIFRHGGPGQ